MIHKENAFLFQMHDERNYHIFYCMFAGLNAEEKRKLEITKATDYYYLIQVRNKCHVSLLHFRN